MKFSSARSRALLSIALTAPLAAHAQDHAANIPALDQHWAQHAPVPKAPSPAAGPAAALLFDAGTRLDVESLPGTRLPVIDQNVTTREILLVNQEPGAVITVGSGPSLFSPGKFFVYFRTKQATRQGVIPPTALIFMLDNDHRFDPDQIPFSMRNPLIEQDGELRLDAGGNPRIYARYVFRRNRDMVIIKLEEQKVGTSVWQPKAYMIADLNRHRAPLP